MTITVRLPGDTESRLREIARRQNKTNSDIIKESLDLYFADFYERLTPFELGKDLFGKHSSSPGSYGELSINSEQILRERLGKKTGAKKLD